MSGFFHNMFSCACIFRPLWVSFDLSLGIGAFVPKEGSSKPMCSDLTHETECCCQSLWFPCNEHHWPHWHKTAKLIFSCSEMTILHWQRMRLINKRKVIHFSRRSKIVSHALHVMGDWNRNGSFWLQNSFHSKLWALIAFSHSIEFPTALAQCPKFVLLNGIIKPSNFDLLLQLLHAVQQIATFCGCFVWFHLALVHTWNSLCRKFAAKIQRFIAVFFWKAWTKHKEAMRMLWSALEIFWATTMTSHHVSMWIIGPKMIIRCSLTTIAFWNAQLLSTRQHWHTDFKHCLFVVHWNVLVWFLVFEKWFLLSWIACRRYYSIYLKFGHFERRMTLKLARK